MTLTEALHATAELCGTKLSEPAAMLLVQDLAAFDTAQVIAALARCRRELKGRLTVAEVLCRLDDGRPGMKEAWALIPQGEEQTTVWTDEIAEASSVVKPLLDAGDKYGARAAFEERYTQLVNDARANRVPVHWWASLGYDRSLRDGPIQEAVQKGRLSPAQAHAALPSSDFGQDRRALPSGDETVPMPESIREQLRVAIESRRMTD